ncbi:MAG: xanthine dehydrogenase family protein molybdopterin-binding subunit [Nitrososphaerota archaeon]|nr:xanthine dehydrogenase family protein molybdopterin-binding subunit [Nitrososphaerota archaeon]
MKSAQVAVQKEGALFGKPLKRVEDPKFMTGSGTYLGDLRLPDILHAAFVRSPYANARVVKVDVAAAVAHPKVVGVLLAEDLEGKVTDLPTVPSNAETKGTTRKVLSGKRVRHVGEPIAMILAEDRYSAEDALELVQVEYDPLPAVVDAEKGLEKNSPRVHEHLTDNIAYHFTYASGEIERAFKEADHVVKVELVNQRVHPVSLEPRGVAASYDEGNGDLTIWLSCQDPHGLRNGLAGILKMSPQKVRLIAPDVGGGFGGKALPYPEDVAVPFAAMKFRRPVKWEEDRREHMLMMSHGRGQKQYAELAVMRNGRILGLKTRIVSDAGAYSNGDNTDIPFQTFKMGTGVYDIPAYQAEIYSVLTNKTPQGSYRGAGRPEAAYLIERAVEIMARKLKLDPVKVRRLNFIEKQKFPFKTPAGYVYDSGDYEKNLSKALEVADYDGMKEYRRKAREQGRLVGIGMATWTEVCGFSPSTGQTASVTIDQEGQVLVTIGGHPHGQGHATPISQVVADELGIGMELITVRHGDTSMLPWGSFTAGSRTALSASAALLSARKLKEKMGRVAAKMLSVEETEMRFREAKIFPAGSPSKSLTFLDVARASYDGEKVPQGMETTLFAYTSFTPPNFTFPFGTHIAMVEVDKQTGSVKVIRYFGVDDCGRVINPLVVEGQIHGGVYQGVGQALLEEVVYDDTGQLLTATLADYSIPTADLMPEIVWDRTETTTDSNPLGVKGVGEAPTIAATPTIMNAVEDALAEYGAVVQKMPARPDYIKSLIG